MEFGFRQIWISPRTYGQLNRLSLANSKSKSSIVSLFIEAVCQSEMSVVDAARAIIAARVLAKGNK